MLDVIGCEEIGWYEAVFVTDETFYGPKDILYRIYETKEEFKQAVGAK